MFKHMSLWGPLSFTPPPHSPHPFLPGNTSESSMLLTMTLGAQRATSLERKDTSATLKIARVSGAPCQWTRDQAQTEARFCIPTSQCKFPISLLGSLTCRLHLPPVTQISVRFLHHPLCSYVACEGLLSVTLGLVSYWPL